MENKFEACSYISETNGKLLILVKTQYISDRKGYDDTKHIRKTQDNVLR